MKPITLTLKNFGTFVEETTIDFQALSKDGVFLITGETGSGKTTIFDAICYALYGKANGHDREPRDFRSEYADPKLNASVDLTFECRGKVYSIHREPPYTKGVVSSDGSVKYNKTETPTVVELRLPDGTAQSGDDVRKTIQEIVGLTCEQFRQVVMIAQGEFKKFLLAKSEDKGKILGTIFGTEKYDRFLEVFKNYASQCKNSYLKSLNAVVGEITSFTYDDGWEYAQEFEAWRRLPPEDKDVEIVLPHCKDYIDTLSEEKSALEKSIATTQQSVERLSEEVAFHESVNASIQARDRLTVELERLTSQQSEIDNIKQTLRRLDDALSIKDDYQNCLNVQKKGKDLRRQLDSVEESIVSCEESMKSAQYQRATLLSSLPYEVDSPDDVLVELTGVVNSLQNGVSELSSRVNQIDSIINSISSYGRETRRLETERVTLANKTLEKSRLDANYFEQENLYNRSIAGILAEGLEDGKPCIVCGSVHHPHPATRLINAPSKGQLEVLKQQIDRYQAEYIQYQTNFLLHRELLQRQELEILESANVLGVSARTIDDALIQLTALKESIAGETRELLGKIQELRYCIDTLKILDSQLLELSYRLNGLKSSRETIAMQVEDTTIEHKDLRERYFKDLEELGFASQDEHIALLRRSKDYETLSRAVMDFERGVLDYSSRISEYSKAIGDNVYLDTTELSNALAKASTQYQILLNRYTQVTYFLGNDTKVYSSVSVGVKGVVEKYQKYKDTEKLYKFANGTITKESNKVAFNNYVQAYYFDKVLASANEKIKVMSSGRYSLVNSNKANKRSGLDISVFDVYTGTIRSATTLSGGETFMASLSLALGLSEVVQQLSGGVKIDAMFIDEGFGTLDSGQSLQHAVEVIKSLTTHDRMVGIISHVSELQECIPNRLRLVKSKEGSKIINN